MTMSKTSTKDHTDPRLSTRLVRTTTSHILSPYDEDRLNRTVSWETPPEFSRCGRTSWLRLRDMLKIELPDGEPIMIRSLKIKGVGLLDHRGRSYPPDPSTIYRRLHRHLGFLPDGRFKAVATSDCPQGGMILERAVNEFESCEVLFKSAVLSPCPLRVYAYDTLGLLANAYGSKPARFPTMGTVVTGYESADDLRLSSLMFSAQLNPDEAESISGWYARLGVDSSSLAARCLAIERLCSRIGKSIRQFHRCGFYRFSGHFGNYTYSTERDQVLLVDLDSSRRLEECNDTLVDLQRMRDLSSGLYGIVIAFLSRKNMGIDIPETLARCFKALLEGYFDRVFPQDLCCDLLYLSEKLFQFASMKHRSVDHVDASDVKINSEISFQEYRRKESFQYWIERESTYCYLMATACSLFELSGELKSNLRFETLSHLMDEYVPARTISSVIHFGLRVASSVK
jgi:hypothetical protein